MDALPQAVGAAVKARRKELRKTQAQLAEELAIEPRTLQRIEAGKGMPSVPALYRIAHTMNLSIDEMFFGPSGATSETHARLERRIAECDEQQKKVLLATANALLERE